MAKVFISYSRKDIEFAKRLTSELQNSDLDFWIDWEGIPPTVDWWKEIEKGIEEADIFLFLISPDSARSKVCGQEIDTAVNNGKRIIPIVVRETDWQDTQPQLRHLNYIFFTREDDFDTAVKKLTTAIHADYEWAAVHRRLQVKALEWERNNKENSFLLRGKDLEDAELQFSLHSSKEPHPTNLQLEYMLESRKVVDQQRRFSRRRLIILSTIGVTLLTMIALAATDRLNRFIFQPVETEGYWVTIPSGEFLMGGEHAYYDSKPIHNVRLEEYEIGKYEVTNKQYLQCIKANVCAEPDNQIFDTAEFADHPVTGVRWQDADSFCRWFDKKGRLPTEAEWEKAASWDVKTKTKRIYPWGETIDVTYANYIYSNLGGATVVGSYPKGASPYGVYDMAGNVWEWVGDWYGAYYYSTSPEFNPTGPATGVSRVIRGGCWLNGEMIIQTAYRSSNDPTDSSNYLGFRCARDTKE